MCEVNQLRSHIMSMQCISFAQKNVDWLLHIQVEIHK